MTGTLPLVVAAVVIVGLGAAALKVVHARDTDNTPTVTYGDHGHVTVTTAPVSRPLPTYSSVVSEPVRPGLGLRAGPGATAANPTAEFARP